MAALIPVVEILQREVDQLDERLLHFKKAVSRLVDLELTSGLSADAEKKLEILTPQFSVIEQETADISSQVGLLMGKMNRLSELTGKLEILVRMGAAMDGAIHDLVPAMAVLKNLGMVLVQVQKSHDPRAWSLTEHLEEALNSLQLPTDTLLQLEIRLAQQVEHYIDPVVEPLQDLAEQLRARVPNTHMLNGLESTLLAQSVRFGNVSKLVTRLFSHLERIIADVRQTTHAA
jgi:hypothetical protein